MMDKLNYIREQIEQKVGYPLNINSRKRNVIYARAIYFGIAKDLVGEDFTLETIGATLGKDHSTVIHALSHSFHRAMQGSFYSDIYFEIKDTHKEWFDHKNVTQRKLGKNTREYVARLKNDLDSLRRENEMLKINNRKLKRNAGNDEFASLTYRLNDQQLAQVMERVKLTIKVMESEVYA
jgi:regulator of replication initiation timing